MAKGDILLRTTTGSGLTAKGSALTHSELDANFIEIYNALVSLSQSSSVSAYNAGTEYNNTTSNYVAYASQLWKFINATPATGVTPGTDPTRWIPVYASDLAHRKNSDTYLDEGGANEVSAASLKLIDDEVTGNYAVRTAVANLTSAEVLAGFTTGGVIKAHGGKKIRVLEVYSAIVTYGTTPYDTGVEMEYFFDGAGQALFKDTKILESTAARKIAAEKVAPTGTTGTQISFGNADFRWRVKTADPLNGDSDIQIVLIYIEQ